MIWYWSIYDFRTKQRRANDTDWILLDLREPYFKAGRRREYKSFASILWRCLLSALQGQNRDDISPYMMLESGRYSSVYNVKMFLSLQQRLNTLALLVLNALDSHCDPSYIRDLWMTSFLFFILISLKLNIII